MTNVSVAVGRNSVVADVNWQCSCRSEVWWRMANVSVDVGRTLELVDEQCQCSCQSELGGGRCGLAM